MKEQLNSEMDSTESESFISFRQTLRDQFELKVSKNSSYSLRAFSRDLKMSASMLSEVLAGKKKLSLTQANKIAENLKFDRSQTNLFLDQVEVESGRTESDRERAYNRVMERLHMNQIQTQLTVDSFKVVSDWYHFAILALFDIQDFKTNIETCAHAISRKLGIHIFQANEALGRLERLGLIKKSGSHYLLIEDAVFSPEGVPSEFIRKFHDQLLQKASHALSTLPFEKRDFNGFIMSVNSDELPHLYKELREFYFQLFHKYSKSTGRNQVVSLMSQVFPLIQEGKLL